MAYEHMDLQALLSLRRQVKHFMRMGWSKCLLNDVDEAIKKRREADKAERSKPKPRRRPKPAKRYPKQRKGESWHDWYQRYLMSPHWLDLRRAKMAETGDRCEQCLATRDLQVHHLTYKRLRQETLADLRVLCRDCHNDAHGHQTTLDTEFRAMFQ